MSIDRRTFVKAAAWSVPVIAVAVSAPLAAASAEPTPAPRIPISCTKLPNHGHGGQTGNHWWQVAYNDGTAEMLSNGTVMSDRSLRALCRQK